MSSDVIKGFSAFTHKYNFSIDIQEDTLEVIPPLRKDVLYYNHEEDNDPNGGFHSVCECVLNKIVAVGRINIRIGFTHYGEFLEGTFRGFGSLWTYWDLIHLICASEEHALLNNRGVSFSLDHIFFEGADVIKSEEDGIVSLSYFFGS